MSRKYVSEMLNGENKKDAEAIEDLYGKVMEDIKKNGNNNNYKVDPPITAEEMAEYFIDIDIDKDGDIFEAVYAALRKINPVHAKYVNGLITNSATQDSNVKPLFEDFAKEYKNQLKDELIKKALKLKETKNSGL